MNPFQTYKARIDTVGAIQEVDPRLIHAALGLTAAGIAAPSVAGGIDYVSGSQKVSSEDANFGELGINYLLAGLAAPAIFATSAVGSELLNRHIDTKAKAETVPSSYSPHSAESRKELKRISNEQGVDAAAAWNAAQKAKADGPRIEGNYTRSGQFKRRMAGIALSSLLGAGITIPLMADEQY